MARLNLPFISFQAKTLLADEQKRDFDHASYADAITQVLSKQLLEDQQRAHANKLTTGTAAAAAFIAADKGAASSDPRKMHLPVCGVCGTRGLTANACWRNPDATDQRAIASAPKNSLLAKRVASERANANSRRRRRMPPRSAQAPAPDPTLWADSREGADAAIAYATGTHVDNTSKDGLCFSAVAFAHALAPPQGAHIVNFAIDSGATWHPHGRREDISKLRPCHDTIAGIDGAVQKCLEIRTVNMVTKVSLGQERALSIKDVRRPTPVSPYCPLQPSSWRGPKLRGQHSRASRSPEHALRRHPAAATNALPAILTIHHHDNKQSNNACIQDRANGDGLVATFQTAHAAHAQAHINNLSTDAATTVMYRRLQIGVKAMRRLPTFTADAPPSLAKASTSPSSGVAAATMKRISHSEAPYRESTPSRLFHMDLRGPLPESKLGRFRYAMVLVDYSTRFKMGLALRTCDEAGAYIRSFLARFNSLAAHSQGRISKVGTRLTDGAGEFLSHTVQHICSTRTASTRSKRRQKCMHALINGVAERAILSILLKVRIT